MYILNREEEKDMYSIVNTYYMEPILNKLNSYIEKNNISWQQSFNKIYEVLLNSKDDVKFLVNQRIKRGEIKNIDQAMKSIAGNAFSNIIVYIFLKNKIQGYIKPNIFITSRKKRIKNFNKITAIQVGDQIQKPDIDLVIYNQNFDKSTKFIILSLKTSMRERAGQTYKWKLLEIATTENPIKDKYNIFYSNSEIPYICFATVNFYNEIYQPQHRGILKFFDKSFIAKEITPTDFIEPLSNLVDFVNEKLG